MTRGHPINKGPERAASASRAPIAYAVDCVTASVRAGVDDLRAALAGGQRRDVPRSERTAYTGRRTLRGSRLQPTPALGASS